MLKLPDNINRIVHTIGFQTKKHAPEICTTLGIIGGVGATVLACKATRKVDAIFAEKKQIEENIKTCLTDHEVQYTEEDAKKDTYITNVQTGVKLLKVYSPAIVLGTLSIASILFGQRILKKRYASLGAAYIAMEKGFKNYRKNVVERFGEEVDKELKYGIKAKEIVEKDEKGKEHKKTVYEIDGDIKDISPYARFFEESSDQWKKDSEYNLMFLRKQQDYANEVLRCKGYLFLNDVYAMLGIPKTKAGQVVGWKWDSNGDNYVDFGIYDITGNDKMDERKRAFVNGYERNILLDFNVDGNILGNLEWEE